MAAINAPSTSFAGVRETEYNEVISQAIGLNLMKMGPFWEKTVLSSANVMNVSTDGSKDYLVNRLYRHGLVGVGQFDTSGVMMYGQEGQANPFPGLRVNPVAGNIFPSAGLSADRAAVRLTIPMRSQTYNYNRVLTELQASGLSWAPGEDMADKDFAFATKVAMDQCLLFYASGSEGYSYCALSSATLSTPSGGVTNSLCTFVPSNGAVWRFEVGQRVDLRNTSTGARINESGGTHYMGIIVKVDPTMNEVGLMCLDPLTNAPVNLATTFAATIASTTHYVCPVGNHDGTNYYGIAGLGSWVKNSGDLLGTEAIGSAGKGKLDVDTFPWAKSIIKAVNGPLTEDYLLKVLTLARRAYAKGGGDVDTMFTTPGVIQNYREQKRVQAYIQTESGGPSNLANEGFSGPITITDHNGRKTSVFTDDWIETGTLWGHRLGNGNWERLVAPNLADGFGANSMARNMPAALPFHFIAPFFGFNGPDMPVYATSGQTNDPTLMTQRPGYLVYQLAPKDPRGIKLTGIDESVVLNDT